MTDPKVLSGLNQILSDRVKCLYGGINSPLRGGAIAHFNIPNSLTHKATAACAIKALLKKL